MEVGRGRPASQGCHITQRVQSFFGDPLGAEEDRGAARPAPQVGLGLVGQHAHRPQRLPRQGLGSRPRGGTRIRAEHPGHLEERHVGDLPAQVLAHQPEQGRGQRGAQQPLGVLDRVAQTQRRPARVVLGQLERGQVRLAHEGERPHLDQARPGQGVTDALGDRVSRRLVGGHQVRHRQRGRDVLVAVDARDLLGQVLVHVQVVAVARDRAREGAFATGRRDHAHARQQRCHLLAAEGQAEQPIGALHAQLDPLGGGGGLAARLDGAGRDPAAGELGEQPRRAVGRTRHARPIHAALEAVRRLAVQAVAARRQAHAHRLEVRALDQHVGGVPAHLAVGAAHHAGDRHRALGVRDHQVLRVEPPRLAVEGRDRLARRRAAHPDLAARQLAQIEGVERLAELEQHGVGHVDDVVDRAETRRLEARTQGVGGRRDAHAPHHATHVVEAAVAGVDADPDRVGGGRARFLDGAGGQPQRASEQRRDLARDTEQRRGVAAVGGETQLEHALAHRHRLGQGRPDPRVLVQHPDALVSVPEGQLGARADHPLGGHTAQLRLLDLRPVRERRARERHGDLLTGGDVGRAAHDRAERAVPHVDRAHREAVGVGVRIASLDPADDDVGEVRAGGLDDGVLEARHVETVGEGAVVGQLDELGQPGQRQAHQI